MSEPKIYEIESLEQLVNIVTPENIDRLSVDFLLWLNTVNNIFANFKASNEDKRGLNNSDIAAAKFIWIDDNKHEIDSYILVDTTTGDIEEIKAKR